MAATKIEWCDVTVNPVVGCLRRSEGCANCYAERMARRLQAMGLPQYQGLVDWGGWTGRIGLNLDAMRHIPGSGKKVFVGSMTDLFYCFIGTEERNSVFDAIREQRQHTFIVATKRIALAAAYFASLGNMAWDNLWLLASAENQKCADERIPTLLQIQGMVRGVSLEPLLGPIDLEQAHLDAPEGPMLDWVIVGCESGPGRRTCETQWVADIVDQCRAANVPVFVKQIDIDGKVVHDVERIALELSDYCGEPLCAEDIRQYPRAGRQE